MKKSILQNLSQLLLIVFSVVLGLFLSERIEEKKEKKEAQELLRTIKSEVAENKRLLEYWYPYHQEIVKNLDSLSTNETFVRNFIVDETTLFKEALTRGNIMGDRLSNDAWDIAKSHPLIVNFDSDELLILSRLYNQQENTYQPVPGIIELILSPDFNSKEKAEANIRNFGLQMREVASREAQLLRFFDDAANILNLEKN